MKIDKDYKGLIDEGYRYKIEGDIKTTENLVIDLDKGLFVTGYIQAGGYIYSGKSIQAGGSIKAGWYIKANGSIKAKGNIKSYGVVNHGILKELGLPEESDDKTEDKTEDAMKLLKEKGYRIIKV